MKKIKVGIQLYTVRDECAKDFKETVKAIAAMGYKGVETAGNYGGLAPVDFAAFLKELGLELCGQHTSLEEIMTPGSRAHLYAKATGCPYVTVSLAGDVAKDWKAAVVRCAAAGKAAKAAGLVFTYHNHNHEFAQIDGEYALDYLYRKTGARSVFAELDTYWIKKGGPDPVAYIRKYPRRVPQIHLKDMDRADGSFTEVGAGLMDLPAIFDVAREVGTKWIIVEQDLWKRPAIESARISIDNLRKAGLV